MRIALVGGGSIAASFLIQLVRAGADTLRPPLFIDIYEPLAILGPGEPYSIDEPECTLLNAPSFAMSAIADDKSHFLRWLEVRAPEAFALGEAAFLPRRLYGAYLREVVAEARMRAANHGWEVHHHRARVIDIVRDDIGGKGYRIHIEGGAWFSADQIVLCPGNLAPARFEGVRAHSRFLNSPYPIGAFTARVSSDDTVVMLGTSLSAIDAIVALERRGHRGRIHAFSRQGRLPAVRVPSRSPLQLVSLSEAHLRQTAAANGGRLRWAQIRQFFVEDFLANGGRAEDYADATRAVSDPVAYLEAELAAAVGGRRLWLDLGLQLTAVIDLLWELLEDEGKREFALEFQHKWSTRRVTFPVENARILLAMLRRGQLNVGAGLADIRPSVSGPGLDLYVRDSDGRTSIYCADLVVNATGPSTDVTRAHDPLLRNILARGLGKPHPFGGLVLETSSGLLINDAGSPERIAVLGSLSCGAYFWTYSMDMNARLAARQVQRLLGEARVGARYLFH